MSPIVRRKGERFTLPSKYLLFILTCVCVVLMIVSLGTDLFNKPLNATVSYVVVPFQQGISKAGTWLANRSDELVQIRQLLEENEALKEQIAELTVENTQLLQEKTELNRYRELYKMDMQYDNYTKIGAKIISRDAGNWYSTFIIDKGTDDSLAVDMNVIAEGGLVGRITSIGPNWAKVTSIIDDNSNVSAKTLATSDLMIVSGDLAAMSEGVIRFNQLIDSQDKVAEADKVVTSHISDKYLPDILIGFIYSVQTDSNNLTKSGYLVPAVDFEHLEDVLVILGRKETIEE